ncbi:MAG: caspase family protein [Methylocella sp.]
MKFLHCFGTTLRVSFLYAAVFLAAILPANAEKRVALVVGNSAYRNVPPLTNPANDAKLIAGTLQSLGFELVGGSAQLDLDRPGFEAIVKRFGTLLQGAEVGLFYYAGHGVQVRGENYLVPVSANPEREADVDFEMLNTSLVMRQMEGASTRLNLVLLDACRNNPFGTRATRSASRGLAQMEAPEGSIISFATQPGSVASDGEDGDSPYTKALAETMRRPGLDIFKVFNDVGLEVKKRTGGNQQPWLSASPITGSFYFATAPEEQPQAVATAPVPSSKPLPLAPAPAAPPQQTNEAQQIWGTIQNTTSVAVLERYIREFPASFYADIARARLEELTKNQVSAPAASAPLAPPPPMSVSALEQKPEPAYRNDPPKVTRYPNMDAPGNDAPWVRGIANVEECESLCLSDPACAGYTYNIKYTTCIPKTAIGPLTRPGDPAITGVVERQSREAVLQGLSVEEAKPSFDCLKARAPVEHAICASQTLSRLDSELSNLYHAWTASHSGAAASVSQYHQREFLAARKSCGANTTCLEEVYRSRIGDFPGQPQSWQLEQGRSAAYQSAQPAIQNRVITIAGKPSFDCRKATSETSQTICASPLLIKLDLQLAKLFWAKMATLRGASAAEVKRRQYDWGVARNQCGTDAACVEQSYQRRIAEFEGHTYLFPVQQAPEKPQQQVAQKPQPATEPQPQTGTEERPKGPIATGQQLSNPIRLIGQADQPCDVASATLARLRKSLSVSVPGGLTM